jgi:hypothetical protein
MLFTTYHTRFEAGPYPIHIANQFRPPTFSRQTTVSKILVSAQPALALALLQVRLQALLLRHLPLLQLLLAPLHLHREFLSRSCEHPWTCPLLRSHSSSSSSSTSSISLITLTSFSSLLPSSSSFNTPPSFASSPAVSSYSSSPSLASSSSSEPSSPPSPVVVPTSTSTLPLRLHRP